MKNCCIKCNDMQGDQSCEDSFCPCHTQPEDTTDYIDGKIDRIEKPEGRKLTEAELIELRDMPIIPPKV